MKNVLILIIGICIQLPIYAQVSETTVRFQKNDEPAAVTEYPYDQEVVAKSIDDYMMKQGYKKTTSKGFTIYKGYKEEGETSDLYFKIEPKNKKEKDKTIVTVFAQNENKAATTKTNFDISKNVLNSITPTVATFNTGFQINKQEQALANSSKQLDNYSKQQKDIEKNITNLQSSLEKNKKDQQKQTGIMADNVHSDDKAIRKAHKNMDKLLKDQQSLQKKLTQAQTDLETNKKNQLTEKTNIVSQQQLLKSLRGQ